ncbi:hypothetical protein D3C74_413220 [compost metagenome]
MLPGFRPFLIQFSADRAYFLFGGIPLSAFQQTNEGGRGVKYIEWTLRRRCLHIANAHDKFAFVPDDLPEIGGSLTEAIVNLFREGEPLGDNDGEGAFQKLFYFGLKLNR